MEETLRNLAHLKSAGASLEEREAKLAASEAELQRILHSHSPMESGEGTSQKRVSTQLILSTTYYLCELLGCMVDCRKEAAYFLLPCFNARGNDGRAAYDRLLLFQI